MTSSRDEDCPDTQEPVVRARPAAALWLPFLSCLLSNCERSPVWDVPKPGLCTHPEEAWEAQRWLILPAGKSRVHWRRGLHTLACDKLPPGPGFGPNCSLIQHSGGSRRVTLEATWVNVRDGLTAPLPLPPSNLEWALRPQTVPWFRTWMWVEDTKLFCSLLPLPPT